MTGHRAEVTARPAEVPEARRSPGVTLQAGAPGTTELLPDRLGGTASAAPSSTGDVVAARGPAAQRCAWSPPPFLHADLDLLSRSCRALLASYGHERTVDAGTVVAHAGDPVSQIQVVTGGELELKARVDGARVTAGVVRAGGVIADIPFLMGAPMPYDAVASRETDLIVVPGAMWTQLVGSSSSLGLRWMTSLARRLDDERRRLLVVTSRPLIGQIAYLLLSLSESGPDGVPVVRLSQSTIAQLLGARRQSVTRAVSELRNDGLIQTAYGSVLLLDAPGLRRVMGGDPLP